MLARSVLYLPVVGEDALAQVSGRYLDGERRFRLPRCLACGRATRVFALRDEDYLFSRCGTGARAPLPCTGLWRVAGRVCRFWGPRPGSFRMRGHCDVCLQGLVAGQETGADRRCEHSRFLVRRAGR